MIVATETWLDNAPDAIDVCIAGAGPAGVALAVKLARAGRSVLLLEAGGEQADETAQHLHYGGRVADPAVHWPLDTYRVRALGGTSRLWGGRCIPYDPIDFATRPWVPHANWPIGYDDIAPYFPAALEMAEAGRWDYTPAAPIVPGLEGARLHTTTERFSRPTDFWHRYGGELAASPNLYVAPQAPVTAIRLTGDGGHVDHLEVALPNGRRVAVRAREYVIAAGGLETTRLLLASNDVMRQGIGNAGGWLGRGYMCHLAATFGEIAFTADPASIGFDYERDGDGIYIRRRIALTEEAQRELGLMNFTARLHIADANDPAHGDPVLSLIFLAAFRVKYEYSRGAREADRSWPVILRHIGNILRHPFRLAHFLATWGRRRYLSARRIPSIALRSPRNVYPLEFHCEQAPNRESRVSLTEERDPLGVPRLLVDWRTTPLDFHTVREAYRLMARELERSGAGRLTFDDAGLETAVLKAGAYGGHHSGTTRMSASPDDGVVDADCRVHGVDNLFIASSSVLATSSQANPTLTMLALTLRLGDHLIARSAPAVSVAGKGIGKIAVVTGAAGFLGRRVVAHLAAAGFTVRAGVRQHNRAEHWRAEHMGDGPIAPVAMNVMEEASLAAAFEGADIVVHCAVGGGRDMTVITQGTRHVAQAAVKAGVRHLIHISSVAVYGLADGVIDEDASTDHPHGAYGAAKCAAEQTVKEAVQASGGSMMATIMRPTQVYGAGSEPWVDIFTRRMKGGRWRALGAAGEGTCNLVHVDDLAAFITHRACTVGQADADEAVRLFNVNGTDLPSWNNYLARLNQALGLPPVAAPSRVPYRARLIARKAMRMVAVAARRFQLSRVAERLDQRAMLIPSADEQERFASKRRYAIDAMVAAGFTPSVTVEAALEEIARQRDGRKDSSPEWAGCQPSACRNGEL